MRTASVYVGVLVLLALLSFVAFGISLCSYRSPETLLTDAGLSFSYQFFDDPSSAAIDVSTGQIDFSLDRLRDTETYAFVGRLDGHVGLMNFRPSKWSGEGAMSFRYYVSEELPLFGFGGLRSITATGQPQLGLEIRSGFGLGRFYDVTPLAKAMTIHRNLRLSKIIRTPLSDAVLLEIAQTIGGLRTLEIETVTDAVAAIEASIEAATGVQLNARSLLMIEDVVRGTEPQRFCGLSAQAGLGYELLDPYGGSSSFLVVLSGDLAYASAPNNQLEGHVSFSGPFDLADENTLTGSFSYEMLITNSTSIETSYWFQRIKPASLAPVISQGVSCALLFEVAAIDVLFGMALSQTTGDPGWSVGFSVSAAMDLL